MMEDNSKNIFNLAAIDIGSNAARILIKQVEKKNNGIKMKKLQFLRIPIRLGMDVFTVGKIGNEREKMLIRTMKIFRQLLVLYNVADYQIYATSAFRDAKNGDSILKDIKKKTKLDICIISGDEEARIIHDDFHASGNLLYMDVGGGSTELSLVCDGNLVVSRSINIGTIRLLKETVSADQWNEMIEQVKEMTHGINDIRIVGSGGNINKLIRLVNKSDKGKTELSVTSLANLFKKMSTMSIDELMETYDLHESRADVIVPAAHIFLTVAGIAGTHTIVVPNVGLADGMINMMAEKILNSKND